VLEGSRSEGCEYHEVDRKCSCEIAQFLQSFTGPYEIKSEKMDDAAKARMYDKFVAYLISSTQAICFCQVINKTTEKTMGVRPSSHERSEGDPFSIGDIPPEVVREAFVYLSPADLASTRLVCRGFNPTAQDVLMSRLFAGDNMIEKVVCGLHLRRLVGFKPFTIKSLDLFTNLKSSRTILLIQNIQS
jgi:hypothetical protein